jgi:uncharacterized protein
MSQEIAEKAVDLFVSLAEGASSIEITLTGGEPLLQFRLIEPLIRYAEKRASRAGMEARVVLKTNGTVLSRRILKFMERHCARVVVSIDGTAHSHDAHRVDARRVGTHSIVCRNIRTLLERGIPCEASLTVHPGESDMLLDSVQCVHELGIHQIDIGPAYGTVSWDTAATRKFLNGLSEVAALMRDLNTCAVELEVGPLYRGSEHIGEKLEDCWGCRAGVTNLAFLPNGQVAGCSALGMLVAKLPELVLGDVWDGVSDEAITRLLTLSQVRGSGRPRCQTCPTAKRCGGGCLAINYSTTGLPLVPPEFYCRTISAISRNWQQAWAHLETGNK